MAVAPSPFGPPSRGVTPPVDTPRFSRPPSVWPAYGDGGFPSADRRSVDAVAPMAAKRKAGFERGRQSEAKRQKSWTDGKGENRLVPAGRMRNAFQHCSKLLDTLMGDRASKAYFNAPVDWETLGTVLSCSDESGRWWSWGPVLRARECLCLEHVNAFKRD